MKAAKRTTLKKKTILGMIYDQETDKDMDSVFERADKAMYEDKMRLKAGENKE